MDATQIAEFIEKDKQRKLKQLLRVKKWMAAHPEEYREKKKQYSKIAYERKKAKESLEESD
jgi:hypothetical protein